MTLDELAAELRNTAKGEPHELEAVERLIRVAQPCHSFDEIERELPAKARYLGPGPWLDAIRESAKKSTTNGNGL